MTTCLTRGRSANSLYFPLVFLIHHQSTTQSLTAGRRTHGRRPGMRRQGRCCFGSFKKEEDSFLPSLPPSLTTSLPSLSFRL